MAFKNYQNTVNMMPLRVHNFWQICVHDGKNEKKRWYVQNTTSYFARANNKLQKSVPSAPIIVTIMVCDLAKSNGPVGPTGFVWK